VIPLLEIGNEARGTLKSEKDAPCRDIFQAKRWSQFEQALGW
jgi:hypothetical protein